MLKGLFNFFSFSSKKNIGRCEAPLEKENLKSSIESIVTFDDLLKDTITFGSISLDDPNFVGDSISSKNRNFILSWLDGEIWQDGFHIGDRDFGYGSIMLISKDMVFTQIKNIQRPSFGKVSNVGVFIITDITFEREYNLMLAYKPGDKESFYRHKVYANIYNQWISDDGDFCAVEACRSNNDHSEKFFLICLKEKKILFQKKLEIGRFVNQVDFLSSKEILIKNEYGDFKYDCKTGNFLDKNKWHDCYIQGLKNKISKKKVSKRIAAIYYRQIGETYQEKGNKTEAIKFYQKALEHDPEVGVKLKLKNLLK
jgi:tetratricopeptide (TPR) repeat protein